jgi:hypothetical protein
MACYNRNSQGLSLIGILVAVWILLTGSLAISRILVARERTVEISRDRIVATASAREGLELIRAIRDTNWFSGSNWTNTLCGGTPFILDARMVINNFPPLVPATAAEEELFITSQGEWVHDNSSANTASGFSRLLSVDCANESSNPAFIIATSTVRYSSDTVEIKENLYNWLP